MADVLPPEGAEAGERQRAPIGEDRMTPDPLRFPLSKQEGEKLRDCAGYAHGGSVFTWAPATMERLSRRGLVRQARGNVAGYDGLPGWVPTEAGYAALEALGLPSFRPAPSPTKDITTTEQQGQQLGEALLQVAPPRSASTDISEAAAALSPASLDRDELGRAAYDAACRTCAAIPGMPPRQEVPWEAMDEMMREVWRAAGEAAARLVQAAPMPDRDALGRATPPLPEAG